MRHPPPGLLLPGEVHLSIRSNSSIGGLGAVESNTAALSLLQTQKLTNGQSSYSWKTSSYYSKLCRTDGRERTKKKNAVGMAVSGRTEKLRQYSEMLHICALGGSLSEGKAVHGHVIKNGIDPDAHLWNSLVNVYARCGSHRCARRMVDEMPERNVTSWTALIAGLIGDGFSRDGIRLFRGMQKDGVRPNGYTLAVALKGCSMCLDFDFGEQLHADVLKLGFFSDIFVGSSLVDFYAKCGEMKLADGVFFCMPERNAVSWCALLNGYAQMGEGEEVLKLFSRITDLDMKCSRFTLSTVLNGCANSGKLLEAQSVHSVAVKIGHELDEYVSSSLLDIYSKFGLPDDALKVFGMIKDPNVVDWTQMINCLNGQGRSQEAVELFCLMIHRGIIPNQFTLASLVGVATNLGDQYFGDAIHACTCKYGFEYDTFLNNALVVMYMKLGCVQKGWLVFASISDRDSASWNALLSGFCNGETSNQGPRIFTQMLLKGFKPDMYTFVSILGSFPCLLDVRFGNQVHAHIAKNGLNGNSSVGTALINMYANASCLEEASEIFNRLHKKDLLTWTVIIAGYVQSSGVEKAIKCFSQMQQEGLRPNKFILSSCLIGCSNLATLETGRQFHSLALRIGALQSTYVASALVDMYVKCMSIEDAEAAFRDMVERNTVSWNTIICGYSQSGKGEKALEAFQLMLDEGYVPDEVTFLGVLSACSNNGLFEEGIGNYNLMCKVYGIIPTIEHHTCVVKILCQAGKFQDVGNYIEVLKLNEDALVWKTVLSANKIVGNIELGRKAAEKLFELEPEVYHNYISLSDLFAAKGRWDDVVQVRALMSTWGIKKEPGCSRVEIDAHKAHTFFAQDDADPEVKEICRQLGELTRLR